MTGEELNKVHKVPCPICLGTKQHWNGFQMRECHTCDPHGMVLEDFIEEDEDINPQDDTFIEFDEEKHSGEWDDPTERM